MDRKLRRILRQFRLDQKQRHRWRRGVQICAAFVVFWTTYAMILPAITWDMTLICELPEHTHAESCYEVIDEETVLTCTQEEHTHTEACYDAPPAERSIYLCGKTAHVHNAEDDCFYSDGSVKCTMEEHSHSDACLTPPAPEPTEEELPDYLCGAEAHTHGDSCYTDGSLTCTLSEHVHSDACLAPQAPQEPPVQQEESVVRFCGMEEHTHGDACYSDGQLTCNQPEHVHSEACLTEPAEKPVYYCGLPEHTHTAGCYQDGSLICPEAEHIHNEDCLVPIYYCDLEEHTHSAACYDENQELICELPEHTHTEDCLVYHGMLTAPRPMLLAEPTHYVPGMITKDPMPNDWQVVSGRYNGGTAETKVITDSDGNVLRLRKNLVPTGVENEFYVYMTVEPVYYHDWQTIFMGSGILVNSANNTTQYSGAPFTNDGTKTIDQIKKALLPPSGNLQGHSSLLVPDTKAPLSSTYTDQSGKDVYIDHIVLKKPDGGSIPIDNTHLVFSFSQNSTASFTIIYCPPNGTSSVKLSNIIWDGKGRGTKGNGGTLTFPAEAYQSLINSNTAVFDHILQRSFPQVVTDPMGDHIDFVEVVYSSDNTAVSCKNGVLTWDLSKAPISDPSQNPLDYERISTDDAYSLTGAYQLVYKIRLRVEDNGFNSAAAQMGATSGPTVNPTNGTTTVSYHTDKHPSETRTANFTVPEVRGLLYDVNFRKLDQYAMGVPGAVFTLTNSAGEQVGSITTNTTSQIYTFFNLSWGTYTLTESIPEDYSAASDSIISSQTWTFPLCYTTNADVLTPDTGALVGNMVYNGGGIIPFDQGALKILNYKFTKEFMLRKVDTNDNPLTGAQFKLFTDPELTEEVDAGLYPSDHDGVFTPANFMLPEGIYYMQETVSPAGYVAPAINGVLTVKEKGNGFTLFWNGKTYASEEAIDGYHTIYYLDVPNTPSVPLPVTGGSGMKPIVIAGILVLALTWSCYFVCSFRKGRWTQN